MIIYLLSIQYTFFSQAIYNKKCARECVLLIPLELWESIYAHLVSINGEVLSAVNYLCDSIKKITEGMLSLLLLPFICST